MFRKLILLLVSTIGLFSSAVFAVGLGEYKLSSGLNQPLKAEIKLLSAGDLSEHEVLASLASAVEFEKIGVERAFILNNIRFETKKQENGSVIIILSSREPIKEPFLNFLVELNWPNGRIIREYTFLLDPPIFEKSTASTIQKTVVKSNQQAEPKAPQTRITQQQNETTYSGATYGPVSETDTLWSIASKVRPSSKTSIHQTLVAIYRANPDAFANGNINNLLLGKVLQIPTENDISQVPHRAALQDVVMQNRQWQSGGARNIVENTNKTTSTKRMNGDARLTLASPDSDSKGQNNGSGAKTERLAQTENQLIRSQETSATLQAENDELRMRLADALNKLEGIQQDSAISISDTEFAVLTQPKSDVLQSGETTPDENTKELTSSIDADKVQLEAGVNDSGTTSNEDTQKTSELVEPVTQVSKPVFVPEAKKSFFEEMIDSGSIIWAGVGLLLIIVLAVFWRMRKRMEEDDFQDDLVARSGAGAIDANETFELPDVGDDMLVELDMDDDEDDERASSDESFDPLGEADIYIAYGKYEQAENLLLDSIEDNPIRSDLKVKLMECYAENDDRDKFESLAEEVSQAVDADEWLVQIDSLRAQAWSGESAEEGFDLPSTEDIFGAGELDSDSDLDLGSDKINKSSETEFNLDDDTEDEFDIEMDLNEDRQASEAVTETFDSLDEDDFSIDDLESEDDEVDELSLDDLQDDELDLEDEDTIKLDDSDDISLDLDDDDFSFEEDSSNFDEQEVDESGDEISTKLDLARAYIDMGDADGAKEILSEVISEGNDSQKQEARALLEKAN